MCREKKKSISPLKPKNAFRRERKHPWHVHVRACVRDYVREDVLLRYLAPLSIVHVSHAPFSVELRENQDLPWKRSDSSNPSIYIFEIIDRAWTRNFRSVGEKYRNGPFADYLSFAQFIVILIARWFTYHLLFLFFFFFFFPPFSRQLTDETDS